METFPAVLAEAVEALRSLLKDYCVVLGRNRVLHMAVMLLFSVENAMASGWS